jgi:ribosomal protein S18 acetylase RimI-like enzyme
VSVNGRVDFAGWSLRPAEQRDIDELMRWFPDREAVHEWGGPVFRFPFTRHSFAEDIHWGRMASFSLYEPAGPLAGFGQLYEREARIHLARLAVAPARRGQGVGLCLVERLMARGKSLYDLPEFSLFVFCDNTQALRCYEAAGFQIADYPEDAPLPDFCFYLTRPVEGRVTRATTTTGGENNEQ